MMELDGKRIVVTFLMHLGDVVLTTPFIHALRKLAPHSHITYVIDKKLADVYRYNPYIDTLVEVDKKGIHNSIGGLNQIAKEIRHGGPVDVVINLHPNERTSYLAWKLKAKVTTGMSHFLFRPFMTKVTRLNRKTVHAAQMYMNVLEQLGYTVEHEGLEIFTSFEWNQKVQDFYASQGVTETDRIIGFNIGSAVPEKRWPKERFAHIADTLAKEGHKIVFFGGPMDEDMVQDVLDTMTEPAIKGTGQFSIGELAAAMKRCDCLVTNDSGPMHVGVSQGVPIVALYGPSNPALYGPFTENAVVLESMDHYDVNKNMKQVLKEGNYKGLTVISEESVLAAIRTMLERKGMN